jgi:NADP-dependent 3-hydroxy acid dehydrogenase YdfG/quinol monooxygenase YgiN
MTKTILITGAGSGFARLVAFSLAEKGHNVIATAAIWPQVTEIIREAKERGLDNITADKLDVTIQSDIDFAVEKYDIDILFSNAGIMEAGPIGEQPLALIKNMFEVNVFGMLHIAQAFIKKFVIKGGGKVVFTSSIGALITYPMIAAYCASKNAVQALADGLQMELEPFNIKIATCNPGGYLTGFNNRGLDTINHWYNPEKNFTSQKTITDSHKALENQLNPTDMAKVMVETILEEDCFYMNVNPKSLRKPVDEFQANRWNIKSDWALNKNNASDSLENQITYRSVFKLNEGVKLAQVIPIADQLVKVADQEQGTIHYNYYSSEENSILVSVEIYSSSEEAIKHGKDCENLVMELLKLTTAKMEVYGPASEELKQTLKGVNIMYFKNEVQLNR